MRVERRTAWFFPLLWISCSLAGQEFELGIQTPDAILENSTFEATFTLTTRGIEAGKKGAEGWTLCVAHRGLTLVSATTRGTIVDELFDGGFRTTQMTHSSPEFPDNEGFISAVFLSGSNPSATLPPEGTVPMARAVYHVDAGSCLLGASLGLRNGLKGPGPVTNNNVSWDGMTFHPPLATRAFGGCVVNDYRLTLRGSLIPVPGPLPVDLRLGERKKLDIAVHLGQTVSTAYGWNLAVAHPGVRLQIEEVTISGTGIEDLVGPAGFVLFEITSGPGNEGFTAQVELDAAPPWAIPPPDQEIARVRYHVKPILDPALVGARIDAKIAFRPSLQGSGGSVRNEVFPAGLLSTEDLLLRVAVLPQAAFLRGDANGDGGVDLTDALSIIFFLFEGLEGICEEAGNSNDDVHLDLTDAIFTLGRLFLVPAPFPDPFPACGEDPTLPSLECELGDCR